jgi:hypothetical protein
MNIAGFMALATGAVLLGVPFLVGGFALLFTIWGILPGIGLMLFSGVPLGMLMTRRAKQVTAWKHRDQVLPTDQPKPWYMESEPDDYPY